VGGGQQVSERVSECAPLGKDKPKSNAWPQKLKNGVGNVDMGDMRETKLKENYVDYVIVHGKSL